MLYTTKFYKNTNSTITKISLSIVIISFSFIYSNILYSANKYMKCWKNSDGVTECGNKIPRQYFNQKIRFIDDSGMTRKVKEKAKSREELEAAEKLEQKKSKQLALENEEKNKLQDSQDVLLKTYLNIDALLASMNSKLNIVNIQSSLLQASLPEKKQNFDKLVEQAADIERSGKKMSPQLSAKLKASRSEMNNTQNQIVLADQKNQQIKQTYSKDVEHFILLKSHQITQRRTAQTKDNYSRQSIQVVQLGCNTKNQCNEYWKKAKQFIKEFATTEVLFENKNIAVSDIPLKHHDIAMALSLLETGPADKKIILLQIRCNHEKKGQQFCATDNVSKLQPEFKKMIVEARKS